jgi:DNA-binding LytR/AlgR family response regulator
MFKLKVKDVEHKIVKDRLELVETPKYNYVVTDDKDLVEEDKINIVFNLAEIPKVSKLLDLIVKGEELYLNGHNEFGQKSVECRNFHYFVVEDDDVYGVLTNTRLLIRMKLYEIEELLLSKEFIRVSKYCLVNIGKIDYIKVALNSKLDLLIKNGEHCEVNRSYLKDFKEALKI